MFRDFLLVVAVVRGRMEICMYVCMRHDRDEKDESCIYI